MSNTNEDGSMLLKLLSSSSLNSPKPFDSPPGLPPGMDSPQVSKATFSTTQELQQEDPHAEFMTQKEKDIVAHLHLSQLRTPLPTTVTDYYYQMLSKKPTTQGQQQDTKPLYFPAVQPRQKRIKDQFRFEGVLGSVNKATHHKPRTQFQVPARPVDVNKEIEGGDWEWEGRAAAEAIFAGCLLIEECSNQLIDVDCTDSEAIQIQISNAQREIFEALKVEQNIRLALLLSSDKGRKATGRALKALDYTQALLVVDKILDLLENIECLRENSSQEELFLADVVACAVPSVAKAEDVALDQLMQTFFSKPSLPWLLQRKTGLVIACILLSRLESLKGPEEDSTNGICQATYDNCLRDRLSDILFYPQAGTGSNKGYYGWQFLALLAVNVDGERKRSMVGELREVIMAIVGDKNQGKVKNLNIFLNALGLDASQLQQ